MALKIQAAAALQNIPFFSHPPRQLTANDDGQSVDCNLVALDRLGCAFDRFVVESQSLRGAAVQRLQQVAEALAKRLTYLLEPISPIETDPAGCVVQMRSSPPQKDDDGTTYYELLVRPGELSLCRYRKAPSGERQAIPAEVTREVLLRLVGDFEAALS